MPRQPASKPNTREHILHTAEQLLARKGIDAVSLNEINKAAGQKNTSALHYHFGNKAGLLQAIVYRQYAEIEVSLQQAMDELLSRGDYSLQELLVTVVTPFVDQLESERGINYVLIVAQLLNKSADLLVKGHPQQQDKARLRAFDLFDQLGHNLPEPVKRTRLILLSSLLFHSLASYAQFADSGEPNPLGSREAFINNLIDVMAAMVMAPVSH